MDILIRNVNASAVKIFDDKAKEKGSTRNQYLKNYIEKLAMTEGLTEKESELNNTISKMTGAMELLYKQMEDMENKSTQMFYLLCDMTDTDPEHLEFLVEKNDANG